MVDLKTLTTLAGSANSLRQSQMELDAEVIAFINNLFSVQGSLENEIKFNGKIIESPTVSFCLDAISSPIVGKVCGMAFNQESHGTDVKVCYVIEANKIVYRWVPVGQLLDPCNLLLYIQQGVAQGRVEC